MIIRREVRSMASASAIPKGEFVFPKSYNYPPLFSPQPTLQTRHGQLRRWSILIQKYCRHYHIYQISVIDALDTPLFHNSVLKKRLSLEDAKEIIDYMTSEEGNERAEWLSPEKVSAWIWWRKPEEWANTIVSWVEETGQKGLKGNERPDSKNVSTTLILLITCMLKANLVNLARR